MQLYAVKFGESLLSANYIFRGASSEEFIPIAWSYYIAKYNQKTILFDVGFRDPQIAKEWDITLNNIEDEVKNELHVEQVDLICITHHHFDHIANIDRFPDAQIIISQVDYLQALEGTNSQVRERLLKDNVLTVDDSYVVENKFAFKVIGGHTDGSSVIYFVHDAKEYVITGDECYVRENLLHARPIGVYSNSAHNESFIRAAYDKNYIPLPCHDLSLFDSYDKVSSHIVKII